MKFKRALGRSILVASFFLNGCATLFSSGTEHINVSSQPAGATYQYGIYSAKTPDTINASRGELAHVITFSAPGYETKTVPVETGIQGVTWWDILFPIGFAVDFASGNAYKVVNKDISVTLAPTAPAAASAAPSPVRAAASVSSADH